MSNSDLYKEQITNAINAFSQKKYSKAEEICSQILSKNDNADAYHIIATSDDVVVGYSSMQAAIFNGGVDF